MNNVDEYNEVYSNAYDQGVRDNQEEMDRVLDNLLSDKEDEYQDELKSQAYDYEEKIERLSDHLRKKDSEIEFYLTEIYELRKANEELQRTIGKNP